VDAQKFEIEIEQWGLGQDLEALREPV